jgi:hypothetical protein
LSHPARRRDGRNTARTSSDRLPIWRRRRLLGAGLSEATARRLLDGSDDGPPPLPQLLAAATAPGTAAELQGETTARAAFRAAAHSTAAPLRGPRTARARTATAIVTTKVIAALALTAGTAGGVTLATSSYSAHLQQNPAVSGTDTATFGRVSPQQIPAPTAVPPTAAPDGTAPSGDAAGTDDGRAAGAGPVAPPGPGAAPPRPALRCEVRCTTETTGGTATPSGGSAKQNSAPKNGDGDKPAKAGTGNGNGPKKEKNTDNGKKADNGSTSDDTKKPGNNNDKAHSDGQSSPGNKQAGVEKGSDKKKTDAEPTT